VFLQPRPSFIIAASALSSCDHLGMSETQEAPAPLAASALGWVCRAEAACGARVRAHKADCNACPTAMRSNVKCMSAMPQLDAMRMAARASFVRAQVSEDAQGVPTGSAPSGAHQQVGQGRMLCCSDAMPCHAMQ